MKSRIGKYLLILSLLLLPVLCRAEGKVYTRRMKMEDLPTRMLKVVLTGSEAMDRTLQREIASRWMLSTYEFCSESDYQARKEDNSYYFLRIRNVDRVAFLTFSKGGKKDDADTFKRPFDIISIPVAPEVTTDMTYFDFFPAYIDIIQQFTSEAMASDTKAYSSLRVFNISNLSGKSASVESNAKSAEWMRKGEPDTVVGVVIAPTDPKDGETCYKMLISTDTHELYMYRTHKISGRTPASFLRSDLVRIYGIDGE